MTDGRAFAIEDYLAVLHGELRLPAREVNRVLAEVSDHLHDATEAFVTGGEARAEAEAHATAQFGDPAELARGVEPRRRLLFEETIRTAVLTLLGMWVLAGVGLTGLLSGVTAREEPMQTLWAIVSLGPFLYLPLGS